MKGERAVLVHSYLEDRDDKDRPDKLTRLGILSAAELYRNGEIDKIVVTVGGGLSENIEKRFKMLLSNSLREEDLIVSPTTATTEGEIGGLKKLSERDENNWVSITTIGNTSHRERVKECISKSFGEENEVKVLTHKKVLSKYPRYSFETYNIIKNMESWPETLSMKTQENLYHRFDNYPKVQKLVKKTIEKTPEGIKILLQGSLFKIVEILK